MRAGIKSITRNTFFLACLVVAACFTTNAQQLFERDKSIGYGGSIIYNFQADGFGADLRAKIPLPVRHLFIVPEISYFPSFNRYHEGYAGGALHYELFPIKTYTFYILGGAYYNKWFNADDYAPGENKENNFALEAGGGLIRNRGCIRPFIENRYDFKWKEDNLRIGILWYPGSCHGKKAECPAFD
jgi:hypothetical protein